MENNKAGIEQLYHNLFPMGLKFELIRIENTQFIRELIELYGDMLLKKYHEAISYAFWRVVASMILFFGGVITCIIVWRLL